MKVRLKIHLFVMLLAVLIIAPTGLALADAPPVAPQQEDPDDGDDNSDSLWCTGEAGDRQHPVATNIAATYQVSYDEVIGYFCDGYGFGEIMLAYETGEFSGDLAVDLLDRKGKGHGWGLIWKELGLIGNEKDGGGGPGKGRGRPDWAGPPDHAGGPHNNTQSSGDDCPGNSCSNPGQGNGKNQDQDDGDTQGVNNGPGNDNGTQDRGDTDDTDDDDSDS